jgi:PBS lyase HEAT-like repeat
LISDWSRELWGLFLVDSAAKPTVVTGRLGSQGDSGLLWELGSYRIWSIPLELDMSRFLTIALCATWDLLACLPSMGANSGSLLAIETSAIRNERSVNARTEDARNLADQVRRNELAVSNADIKLLVDMLSDRDDSVRYWIAMALGYIGPRAQPAVPALEKALQEVQCVHASKTSADAMRLALTKIGATVRHEDCSK